MKAYVVTLDWDDVPEIVAVFLMRSKAKEYIEKQDTPKWYNIEVHKITV